MTSSRQGGAPTRAAMLVRASALVPRLKQRAEDTERDRRLPDATVRDLSEAGLWRILQPARWGGGEFDYAMMVEVPAQLARGCASTAWVHANYAIHHWMLAMWPEQAQAEVWGENADALIASALIYPPGKAELVDGGYRLSGRWPFASGVDPSDWVMLGAVAASPEGDGPPAPTMFMVRKSELEVIDTWHVAGLAGTGSKDVAGEDMFVPLHMTLIAATTRDATAPGLEVNPSPLYRLPLLALFPHVIAGPILGIAMGAYEDYVEGLRDSVSTYNASRLGEHVTVQLRVAEAGVLIEAARLLMIANCTEATRVAERGELPGTEKRARWRRDGAYAAQNCVRAVGLIHGGSGGAANYSAHPLQRRFRDMHAAMGQIQVSWDIHGPEYGRAALGLPLANPNL